MLEGDESEFDLDALNVGEISGVSVDLKVPVRSVSSSSGPTPGAIFTTASGTIPIKRNHQQSLNAHNDNDTISGPFRIVLSGSQPRATIAVRARVRPVIAVDTTTEISM